MLVIPFGAVRDCSPEDRELVEDIDRALGMCGISHDRAAREMGISPQQWHSQRSGREHISMFRLLKLGSEFAVVFYTLRLTRLRCEVLRPGELTELLRDVRALVGMRRKDAA